MTETPPNEARPPLQSLLELTALITSSLDPRTIRQRAIEAAAQLMDADAASLLLLDALNQQLYFEVATGEKGAKLKVVRLRLGEGIAGWVVRTGEGVVVKDVRSDPRFYATADFISSYQTHDLIAAPVQSKGKMLGVLQAVNRRHGAFEESDLPLFQALANQVAIAIENANLYTELHATFTQTTMAFAEALEKRDAYTGGHTARVRLLSLAIGRQLGLEESALEELSLAAVLHDIGKIGVPDEILQKQGRLDAEEYAVMTHHPRHGAEILGLIETMAPLLSSVRNHHERFDGNGYPDRLVGEEIPLAARIIAVADAYDAMATDRPYRKALSRDAALAELRQHVGSQFDPEVVSAFEAACRCNDGLGSG